MSETVSNVPPGVSSEAQELVDEAQALFGAGEYRQAIDFLEEAGRFTPEAAVAQQLIDLRIQAFQHLQWPDPSVVWPPAHDGRYAQQAGFPQIDAQALDAEALKAGIIGKGGLIVRELMSSEMVQAMRHNIDCALAARRQIVTEQAGEDAAAWFNRSEQVRGGPVQLDKSNANRYSETGSLWSVDSPVVAMQLTQFYRDIGLATILSDYFGEAPVLSVRKWVLRCITPNNGGQAGWHQDGRFLGDSDIRTVNLWVALTDCGAGETAPGLELVGENDGTLYETGTQGADFDWTVSQAVVNEVVKTHPVEIPSFKAGDAIFFDHFNLHRTAFGMNDQHNRYAVESWFFAGSKAPGKQQPVVF